MIYFIACGGIVKKSFGSISSPNFPKAQHNLNCQWIISSSPNNNDYIELNFNIIDINDPSNKCIHNYISFGDSINEGTLPRYCNKRRATLGFVSTTSKVIIKYVTGGDVNNSSPGFDADFKMFNQSIISTTLCKFSLMDSQAKKKSVVFIKQTEFCYHFPEIFHFKSSFLWISFGNW